jgi:integrase/recombinase XerC
VATPAGEAWIEGDPRGQLALFDIPERVPTESIALTDTSPRANGERPSLTLGKAARIIREAVKDKSYRSTPLGLEVAHFIRWFRNEYGATTATLRDYEAILGKLALDHADLELADFEPPVGTVRLREFIDTRWGDAAARTRKKVRAVLMSFFRWAQGEFKLQGNPVVPIRSPRLRDIERPLFDRDVVERIIAAQPELRDRVALKLLFLIGIRKGSLAQLRLKDFDLGRRRVRVRTKGGKVRNLPLPTEELRQELELLILGRDPMEYLLFPELKAPRWQKGQVSGHDKAEIGVVRESRLKPLSSTALHRWWYRCLQRAGVVPPGQTSGMRMHAARYTAGTEFYLATGDIRATQQLLGHEDIGTTANIYVQPNEASLERKLSDVYGDGNADNDSARPS